MTLPETNMHLWSNWCRTLDYASRISRNGAPGCRATGGPETCINTPRARLAQKKRTRIQTAAHRTAGFFVATISGERGCAGLARVEVNQLSADVDEWNWCLRGRRKWERREEFRGGSGAHQLELTHGEIPDGNGSENYVSRVNGPF